MATVTAASLCGCGGSSHFANQSRPPLPVNLTVAITNTRVSVSPASIGAGPVTFTITNLSSSAEALDVGPAGSGAQPLVSTSPINPQGTAMVSADLANPGDYVVSASSSGTQASVAPTGAAAPAHVHVSAARASGGNTLLTP
jgi:hypothetical protein